MDNGQIISEPYNDINAVTVLSGGQKFRFKNDDEVFTYIAHSDPHLMYYEDSAGQLHFDDINTMVIPIK